MGITSRTHVRLGLTVDATLADLRGALAEADRLAAPEDAKIRYSPAPGGLAALLGSAGLVIEWTPRAIAEPVVSPTEAMCHNPVLDELLGLGAPVESGPDAHPWAPRGSGSVATMAERRAAVSTGPEICPCVGTPSPNGDISFQVDTVEELLGQIVGACSTTRFWDDMPTDYPNGAGVFRDDVAGRLVDAATEAYVGLQERIESGKLNVTVVTGPQTAGTHQPVVPATTWGSGTRITANSSQAPGTMSGSHR